jgi:beta-lactamase superfamily II metal-dependent hydrolase
MSMTLHFLNVGNGDCTIIELPDGNLMMVDICNGGGTNWEFTDPIHHLERLSRSRSIFRYVQTHPDMDHMDGLAALASKYFITNFWDTANNKPRPDFSSPYSKGKPEDWDAYQKLRCAARHYYRSLSPVKLQGVGKFKLRRAARHYYRSLSPVKLQRVGKCPYELFVLHPTQQAVRDANHAGEWNNAAYVLLLKEGGFKALIAGDIDDGVWEELYDWVSSDSDARSLVSGIWVFKVSHHGRRSGYCGAKWLKLTNPKEIVISKGSMPGEQSAYGNYAYHLGSSHLYLTSKGNVVCSYSSGTNQYSISYQR